MAYLQLLIHNNLVKSNKSIIGKNIYIIKEPKLQNNSKLKKITKSILKSLNREFLGEIFLKKFTKIC